MYLRLRTTNRAALKFCDLLMLVPEHRVQHERALASGGKLLQCAPQVDALRDAPHGMIRNSGKRQSARFQTLGSRFIGPRPTEVHQGSVDRYSVQPGGEARFAAKVADLPKETQ